MSIEVNLMVEASVSVRTECGVVPFELKGREYAAAFESLVNLPFIPGKGSDITLCFQPYKVEEVHIDLDEEPRTTVLVRDQRQVVIPREHVARPKARKRVLSQLQVAIHGLLNDMHVGGFSEMWHDDPTYEWDDGKAK